MEHGLSKRKRMAIALEVVEEFQKASQPYVDRSEEAPHELLLRHLVIICEKHNADNPAEKLDEADAAEVLMKWVPLAIKAKDRELHQFGEKMVAETRSMENFLKRFGQEAGDEAL